ncbi:MAG: class I SAM-dependent methyltransferase [Candidatus Methanoperedens sp.]|nr:class I SAM-dependent methyltransferase [Candidatus Methanoperedens sp.]
MCLIYRNASVKTAQQVYEPAEDSFLLADAALSEVRNSDRVLEVGCGSGIISAVIKANTKASVVGIEINPFAARCSKENGIEVIRGDLLSCIKGEFDLILFNPPYLPTNEMERTKDWINAALDGGYDGRSIIKRFLNEAGNCLSNNGKILLLISSMTGIDEVRSELISLGYSILEIGHERLDFEQLIVLAATRK